MPPGLSPVHLMVIFVVALIVLGPDKMPEAVRKGARLLGEARQWSARISEEMQSAVSSQTEGLWAPVAADPAPPPPASGLDDTGPSSEQVAAGAPPGDMPPKGLGVGPGPKSAQVGPGPRSSLPAGYLPLLPKESS